MKKTALYTALALSLGMSALSAQAATLNNGDVLNISPGVQLFDASGNPSNVSPGSYFGMDTDKNSKIAGTEKTPLAQGTTGLVIGTTTSAGASHGGCPVAGDSNAITAPWCFFGATGSDFLTVAATGGTSGVNLSGWTVTWNGIPAINMGGGAWGTGFTNGVGNLVWNGVYGSTYTLDYHATVPTGDPSGFGGVQYALHLEGTVSAASQPPAVPVPAAAWLLGSGLVGLVGVARRKARV